MRRPVVAVASASAVLLLSAAPAAADDTECVGILPPGAYDNIVVPEGAHCEMVGVQVKGNVIVKPGASAAIQESTVDGNVEGSRVDWVQAAVDTEIGGSFKVEEALDPVIFTGVAGVTIRGSFSVARSRAGANMLGSVDGNAIVTDSGGVNVQVIGAVGGTVHVSRNTAAFINTSSILVGGNLIVTDNATEGILQVADNDIAGFGEVLASGNLEVKRNAAGDLDITDNDVNGNATVSENLGPGAKKVVANRVAEKLECFDNHPPFVGGPNTARDTEGQCF
jgi:hypothetical protein